MPATYRVEFAPAARRQLKKLPREILKRVARSIDNLQTNPYPDGVKKLVNEDNLYRIRAGDYSIVYPVRSEELIIVIVRERHRRDIYG
jgi:mRNA interferase RelE/StbE